MKMKTLLLTAMTTLGITAASTAQNVPSYVPTDGLVGWWPFNGNANDESGNGNNGNAIGVTLTTDRFGLTNSAYFFNGTSNEIEVTNSLLNLVSDFTISGWMSSSDISKFQQCIFNSINHTGFAVELNNENIPPNKLTYGVGPANAFWDLIYAQGAYNQFQNNNWYHIVFLKSGTNYSLFQNNQFDGSSSVPASAGYSQSVGIRFGSIGGTEFFKGSLDDFGIWNRALTPQEITALYTATSSNNNETANTTANVPGAISYQAVARDAQGMPLADTNVLVQFTLIADSLSGAEEYVETHTLTTNSLGLFTTAFGDGTPVSNSFANINWSAGNKFLNVQIDTGTGLVDMGTQQLLSTPYSLHSATSGAIKNPGLPIYSDNAAALAGGLSAGDMYRTGAGILMIVY
jgi:hypothetical protein